LSIFPKKTFPGGAIIVHSSILFNGNPRFFETKIQIISPKNVVVDLPLKQGIYFPKDSRNYYNDKGIYSEGHSGLLYSKFIQNQLTRKNGLADIFQRLTLGTHFYEVFNVDSDDCLGRYQVQSTTIVDGVKLCSSTANSDYFLVERLEIIRKKSFFVVNHSPEKTFFRIVFFDQGKYKELLFYINGKSELKIPTKIQPESAYLIYAEDQKIIPLLKGIIVYRNPCVKYMSTNNGTILNIDDEHCFQIQGEMQDLWNALKIIKKKKDLLKNFDKEIYLELYENELICESAML